MAAQHYVLGLAAELSKMGRIIERIDPQAGLLVFRRPEGDRVTIHARWKRNRLIIDERTVIIP